MTRRGERGLAAIELSAGVALLVLPVALLVLGLPRWASRQELGRLAARDAARVVALAGWCDEEAARQAVDRVGATADLDPGALSLALDCTPPALLARGAAVTARVGVAMPGLAVPGLGARAVWHWTAAHREPVDPYGSRP